MTLPAGYRTTFPHLVEAIDEESEVSLSPVGPGDLARNGDGGETLPFAPLSVALENVPEAPPWVWDGYLALGAVTLLAGRPKVGKSTKVFGLVAAISTGEPFLERKTRATGVLLLSEEREGTLAEKARRWNLNGSVHLLMRHHANGRPWPQVLSEAAAYCHAHALGVLIVDTWDKWTGLKGDAENNAGAVLEALEPLLQAAGSGLSVLIVAHQRKSLGDFGEAVRGSNALTGGVDIVAELERPRSDALAGEGVRVLCAVSRYSGTPEELVIALGEEGYEARGDTLEAEADVERKRIMDALEVLGEATSKQLSEETDLPETTIRRRLEELGEAIRKTGAGKRGDPFRFSRQTATPTGEKENE